MRPSQVNVADIKNWTDFFVHSANNPMLYTSLRQRGGNLGNGTINSTHIVPINLDYFAKEKRSSARAPEITLVSSAERDLQQAKSELRRVRKKRRIVKKRKHSIISTK